MAAARESDEYTRLFHKVETLYGDHVPIPRIASRQTLRANHSSDTAEEYYKLAYFLPYIDHLLTDLKRRFVQSPELVKGETTSHVHDSIQSEYNFNPRLFS